MKKSIFLPIFMSLTILCSCNTSKTTINDKAYVVNTFNNIVNDGEFFRNTDSRVNFIDFNSLQSAVLCSKPNCQHIEDEECSAYGLGELIVPVEEELFFFTSEIIFENEKFTYKTDINKASLDGANRSVVYTLDNLSVLGAELLVYNQKAYFFADDVEFDEYGSSTGYSTGYLCEYDFVNNKFKILLEKAYEGYHSGSYLHGIYNGNIYFNKSEWHEKINLGMNPSIEDFDKLDVIPIDTMKYNLETKAYENSEFTNIVLVKDGYLVYTKDDSIYAINKDGEEFSTEKFYEGSFTIVNDKLFSWYNKKCMDLLTGEVYSHEISDFEEIIYYIDGLYVSRKIDFELQEKIYNKYDESEIIGEKL